VAADHHVVAARAPRHVEPRRPVGARFPRLSLVREHHRAALIEHAQPRHRVDDHAQPVESLEVVVPARRLVAVHALQELAVVAAAQALLDLGSELARPRHAPFGHQSGVHQRVSTLHVQERALAQPVEELVAIGRGENFLEGVALAALLDALGHAHQVQVVVAEHGDGALAQGLHEAQALEGIGAAVDEVAHEPEAIARGIEARLVEQPLQRPEAALEIADRVDRQATSPPPRGSRRRP